MSTNQITAIDLFCGAGGFSVAAVNVGVKILAAIELDAIASQTYKTNLIDKTSSNINLFNTDIMKLEPEQVMKSINLEQGELDLILGGPPCQGFSSHRIKNAGVDDPRNALLIRYFDFVKCFKPKMFLVENVPGLLWERHKNYLDKFRALAEENSYTLFEPVKINACDYGVPQNRKRVFILGIRNDIIFHDLTWPPKPTHFENKEPYWKNASVVFEKPSDGHLNAIADAIGLEQAEKIKFFDGISEKDDSSNVHMQHSDSLTERFTMTPINGSREDIAFRLPCHSNGYVGHKDVYGRIRLGQPGPTITTGCINPSKGRFLHPWKNHGITVREAARFQTFPEDYVFCGGIMSQSKQVGNAVPVELGKVLLKECVDIIAYNKELMSI